MTCSQRDLADHPDRVLTTVDAWLAMLFAVGMCAIAILFSAHLTDAATVDAAHVLVAAAPHDRAGRDRVCDYLATIDSGRLHHAANADLQRFWDDHCRAPR